MWMLVLFDLPVIEKEERKADAKKKIQAKKTDEKLKQGKGKERGDSSQKKANQGGRVSGEPLCPGSIQKKGNQEKKAEQQKGKKENESFAAMKKSRERFSSEQETAPPLFILRMKSTSILCDSALHCKWFSGNFAES